MESLLIAFRAVFPIFVLLGLGYGIKCLKPVPREVFDGCTTLTFQVFLPVHLFRSVIHSDPGTSFNGPLIALAAGGVITMWLVYMLIMPHFVKDRARCGTLIQGCFRGNFVLFGIPLAEAVCGPEAVGMAAMAIAVVVPLFNVISVITLEAFRGGKPNLRAMLLGIVKNPLIIASIIGLIGLAVGLKLPDFVDKTVTDVANIATPLALIALGGTFEFSALKPNLRALITAVSGKLIITPGFLVAMGLLFGFRGAALTILLGVGVTPTAISSYPMAIKMGGDGTLAGQIVVINSVSSVLFIFLWVFLLTATGLV